MATSIGIIKTLIGTVVAVGSDGTQRNLQAGDHVYADEIITTGAAGAVEIEFTDGSVMDLGRNSQAVLDNAAFDPQQVMPTQADIQGDVDALQQALLDGADPTQTGEATAAGAGTQSGDEGHTPVSVEFLAPEVPVTSGFETTGPNIAFLDSIQDTGIINGVPIAINDGPNLLDPAYTLFEDNADFNSPAGNGPGFINDRGDYVPQSSTGNILTNDSFGADGPGGLTSVSYTGASSGVSGTLVGGVATFTMADPSSPSTGPIWTLTVNPDGSYNFTLDKPYTHSGQGEDVAQEQFSYTITDSNGDTASATLTLNIVDDVPHVTTTPIENVAYEFTMSNHDEVSSAGYNSSYGYYVKDANGDPETGVVVWDNVKHSDTVPVTVTGYTPDQIGFFIIPNGDARNPSLTDGAQVTFSQDGNNNWTATLLDGTPLVGNGANVLFDNYLFNDGDNQSHVTDNSLIGNQNWEDLPILTGDGDYNDVNTNVAWTKVTTEGSGLGDVSYGADGAGSINFTLEDISITGGGLFSNGNTVIFTAQDTNSDGINDQLVGKTAAGDTVLTIDGVLDSNAYEINLFADHPIDQQEGSATDLAINAKVQVIDGDGDIAITSLHFDVNISDFIPPALPLNSDV